MQGVFFAKYNKYNQKEKGEYMISLDLPSVSLQGFMDECFIPQLHFIGFSILGQYLNWFLDSTPKGLTCILFVTLWGVSSEWPGTN